jgi:hypothetical protein
VKLIEPDNDFRVMTRKTADQIRQRLFSAGWKVGTEEKFGHPEMVTTNPANGDWIVLRDYDSKVYFHGQVRQEAELAEAMGCAFR